MTRVAVSKGQLLAHEGSPHSQVFALVKGVLKLRKTLYDGRSVITAFRFPGDLVFHAQSDGLWPVDVKAVTAGEICRIDFAAFEAIRGRHPAIDRRLLELAGDEAAHRHEHLVVIGRKRPVERLAAFILELERRAAPGDTRRGLIQVPMTRHDIADYLGLQTETVSRAFSKLIAVGALSLPRPSQILIKDRHRLAQLAEGDEHATIMPEDVDAASDLHLVGS